MGLGIFQRRARASMPPRPDLTTITLRVLVDSGPAARELFDITLNSDDTVSAIREAVAQQIGLASISLFKVSIPWQAHYEASAYTQRYGVSPSLLSVFKGYNMDDIAQLPASGGIPISYTAGNGSLRSKRSKHHTATVGSWFPAGGDEAAIDIIARTASSSSMDWARPSSIPLTLSAYIPGSGRHLVDISPNASIAELKVQLLLSAGLPAPAGKLDALTVTRVDGKLADLSKRRPPLSDNFRVGDFFSTSSADPTHIDLSAALHSTMTPNPVPAFTFPLPMHMLLPSPTSRRMLAPKPLPMNVWATPSSDDAFTDAPSDSSRSTLRCCAHEGGAGLIGLGITMSSPPSAASDNTCLSSDDEAISWPPTPYVGGDDTWAGPVSPSFAPTSWGRSSTQSIATNGKLAPHLHAMFAPPTPLVQ